MSKDKDLEKIKKGEGLKNSSTTTQSSGTVNEQRDSGVRRDQFTLDDNKKKN